MLLSTNSNILLRLTVVQQQLRELQVENAKLVEENRNLKTKCKKSHDAAIQTDVVCPYCLHVYMRVMYVYIRMFIFALK